MAVKVRMVRTGGNKKPSYRIVATDERSSSSGRYLEMLGWYDPKKKKDRLHLDAERVAYWQSCGAKLSDTVRTLIKKASKTNPA